jgi:pimeloyl-ACP methyl ester carboxylesterase
MPYSSPFQGFRLAYDRYGSGRPVVLLHGWPGDRTDYDELIPLLVDHADVIVPDLRGFGESDKHPADAEDFYSGAGQAAGVSALLDELGVTGAVLAGYDIGSFIAQTTARNRPDLVRALVVEHFWNHWSGPGYTVDDSRIDHLTDVYSAPGAFIASIMWYRSSGNPVTSYAHEQTPERNDRLATPTKVLWQEHDPIFPVAWADRLDDFFADHRFEPLPGVGHFTPLEAAGAFAAAIRAFLAG